MAIQNGPLNDSDQTARMRLNLHLVHISEGMFSDFATHFVHHENRPISF